MKEAENFKEDKILEGDSEGRGHNGDRKIQYCREAAANFSDSVTSISGQGLLTEKYHQQRYFGTQYSVVGQKETEDYESV